MENNYITKIYDIITHPHHKTKSGLAAQQISQDIDLIIASHKNIGYNNFLVSQSQMMIVDDDGDGDDDDDADNDGYNDKQWWW